MRTTAGILVALAMLSAQAIVSADTIDEDIADGAMLFQSHCAYCHDRSLPRMPSRDGLKEKSLLHVTSLIIISYHII